MSTEASPLRVGRPSLGIAIPGMVSLRWTAKACYVHRGISTESWQAFTWYSNTWDGKLEVDC
jgi:hypothetical protein